MFKQHLNKIVAILFIVFAQPASAQKVPLPPTPNKAPVQGPSLPQSPTKIYQIKITKVSPRTSAAPASVTAQSGVVWLFNGSGNAAAAGASIDGAQVAPAALKEGMSCLIEGAQSSPTSGLIAKISCNSL